MRKITTSRKQHKINMQDEMRERERKRERGREKEREREGEREGADLSGRIAVRLHRHNVRTEKEVTRHPY